MVDFIEGDWIYDEETFPNIFTCCAIYGNGKGIRVYEISDRRNDTEPLLEFLRNLKKNNCRMVGYNSVSFDYPILHYIIQRSKKAKAKDEPLVLTSEELFKEAQRLIDSQKDERGFSRIKDSEVVIPQVDLFKIHHFDNRAKSTSLKMLEFFMRSENIEDLPFPIGKILTDVEKDVLIQYNKHDVLQTLKFYYKSLDAIRFRLGLNQKFGYDTTNFNDTKIGEQLFIQRLEKAKAGSCFKMVGKRKVVQQTKRDEIDLGSIILPYVNFKHDEFNSILEWFRKQKITETKGVFTDILESDLGSVAQHCNLSVKRQKFKSKPTKEEIDQFDGEYPLGWIEEEELKGMEYLLDNKGEFVWEEIPNKKPKKVKINKKSYWKCWNVAETLNIVVDGLQIDFGVGGIHAARENSVFETTDDYSIESVDVASMYPNLSIQNNISPEHLGSTFCKIYKELYEERKLYPKGSNENGALKLALNGTYGKSNSEFSPFYDPAFTMAITINGQLSLCMLADRLLSVPSLKIIMMNTDGLEYIVHKDHLDKSKDICSKWEKYTKLDLEYARYSKMFIADVNSYIAVFGNGKIKRKGRYEYENLGYHQNSSCLVIPKAAEHELLGKGNVEEFIISHKDKFDFMSRTKVPRSSKLFLVTEKGEVQQQNICRYYISDEGGELVKEMPPLDGKDELRRMGINIGWKVKTCNNEKDFRWDINYDYYITEARKLTDVFSGV